MSSLVKLIKSHQVIGQAVLAPLPVLPGRVVPRSQVQLLAPALVALPGAAAPPAPAPETSKHLPDVAAPAATAGVATQATAGPPVRQARAEADRIVAAAQSRAELIIDEALAGAGRLASEAKEAGFAEGQAAAAAELAALRQELEEERARLAAERLEAQAELAQLRAEAEMSAHQLRHEAAETAEHMVAASQREVVELALAVASRIMRREVERDPEVLIGVLAGALQRVRGAGAVTVKVSPDGAAVLSGVDEAIDRTELGIDTLTVVADPALGAGDVVLETGQGLVDARLDEQLAAVRRQLGEVLSHDGQ